MSQFSTYKWFRNQRLNEQELNEKLESQKALTEEKSKNDRIFDLFFNELEDFDGVADYLTRYKKHIMGRLDSIDFDFLPKPSMMEEALTLGDLELGKNFKKGSSLPFPNSDASKVINSQEDLDDYVAQFGADTEIVMGRFGRYEVPEFEAGREEAAATKAAGIKKFGTSV